MADFKILCPACTSVLSSKRPIPNGKKLTCPHCRKSFVAATSNPGSPSDSSSDFEFDLPAPPSAASSPRHDTPKLSERRSHPSIKLPARSGSRRVALWTVIIGLVVLAAGGGALGMYFYMQPPETSLSDKFKSKKSGDPAGDGKTAQATGKTKQSPRKDDKRSSKDAKAASAKSVDDKPTATTGKNAGATNAGATSPTKRKVADWKEFESKTGGFAVKFPAPPTEKREREEDIIYYETTADLNGFLYEVTFHRLKKDELGVPVKDLLEKIAAEYKDAVLAKKEVECESVPKTPVLELKLHKNNKKDLAIERWLVYKEHVFQIGVSGDKEKLGPDQVNRFMQSFRFIGDPQGGFLDLTQTSGIPPERKKK